MWTPHRPAWHPRTREPCQARRPVGLGWTSTARRPRSPRGLSPDTHRPSCSPHHPPPSARPPTLLALPCRTSPRQGRRGHQQRRTQYLPHRLGPPRGPRTRPPDARVRHRPRSPDGRRGVRPLGLNCVIVAPRSTIMALCGFFHSLGGAAPDSVASPCPLTTTFPGTPPADTPPRDYGGLGDVQTEFQRYQEAAFRQAGPPRVLRPGLAGETANSGNLEKRV